MNSTLRSCLILAVALAGACKKDNVPDPTERSDHRVVMIHASDFEYDGAFTLYAVTDLNALVVLSDVFGAGHNVTSFSVSPDGSQVAAIVETDEDLDGAVWYIDMDTDGYGRVSEAGETPVRSVGWVPDPNVVDPGADEVCVMYRSGADTHLKVVCDGEAAIELDEDGASAPRWYADADDEFASSRFAYVADPGDVQHTLLYTSVIGDPSDVIQISTTAAASGVVSFTSYKWAGPNDLVYRTDDPVAGIQELYAARADGSGNVLLSSDTSCTGNVNSNFNPLPGGQFVAYTCEDTVSGFDHAFVVGIDGAGLVDMTPATAANVNATYSGDGNIIVNRTISNLVAYNRTTTVDTEIATGNVTQVEFAPDGTLYFGRSDSSLEPTQLFRVSSTALSAPTLVSDPAHDVVDFGVERSGQDVWYTTAAGELWSVTDNGAPVFEYVNSCCAFVTSVLAADPRGILHEQELSANGPTLRTYSYVIVEDIDTEKDATALGLGDPIELPRAQPGADGDGYYLPTTRTEGLDVDFYEPSFEGVCTATDWTKTQGPANYPDNYTQDWMFACHGAEGAALNLSVPGQADTGSCATAGDGTYTLDLDRGFGDFADYEITGMIDTDPSSGEASFIGSYTFTDPVGGEPVAYTITGTACPYDGP